MGRLQELEERAEELARRIAELTRGGKSIIIVGHLDADGISSVSVVAKAIQRRKGRFITRIYGEMNTQILEELKSGEYDFHIFCELGAGMGRDIEKALGDRWIVIDHHQIPQYEMEMSQVFNAWQFGFDGGREVSAAGMAYFIAKHISEDNVDMSWLPVVAMVADRQDQGERQSVFGLNRTILEDAVKEGLVEVTVDLILYGRETRPLHEALAATTTPLIPGLSGNRDACLATMASTGIPLKQNGRWRTVADLAEEEKRRVVEAVVPYLAQTEGADKALDLLIGEVYTLIKEDEHSPLRDAREFGTLLNACGRMKKAGVGVSICLGDRGQALQEGERILNEYRRTLNQLIQKILEDEGRVVEKATFNLIIGDGIVDEDLLGSLTSILSGVAKFETKVFIARTISETGDYKLSLRRPPLADQSVNLGLIVQEVSGKCGGSGGGHEAAAGAKVPASQLKMFLRLLDKRLQKRDEGEG